MAMKKRFKSTVARAQKIKEITALHYEAGNQARCYRAVWRHWIEPEFRICYRTYLNYLGILEEEAEKARQFELLLFSE